MRYISRKSAFLPKQWMSLSPGTKIKALKTFKTFNVSDLFGHKKTNLQTTIKKGSTGIVMGMTSPTSLSSTHVARFGRRYVYIYDYDFQD